MKIRHSKKFEKQFKKLRRNEQVRVIKATDSFLKDPFDVQLRNHKLHGYMEGKRSICVGGDLRIVFEEKGDYIEVVFLKVGAHGVAY